MMGTGKTITGLTFILNNPGKQVYILCPNALIFVWQTEIKLIPDINTTNVFYCAYENISDFFRIQTLSGKIVVLDEAHHMSTILRASEKTQGARIKLLNTSHRIVALTGTPIYKDLVDLTILVNICAGNEVIPYNAFEFRKLYYNTIVAKSILFGYAKPILQIFLILFATKLSIAVPKILSISASLPNYYKQIVSASELTPVPNFTTDAINRTIAYSGHSPTPGTSEQRWNTTMDAAHNYTNGAINTAHNYTNGAINTAHNYTNGAINTANGYTNGATDAAHNYTNGAINTANGYTNGATGAAHNYTNGATGTAHNYTNGAMDAAHNYINGEMDAAHNYGNTTHPNKTKPPSVDTAWNASQSKFPIGLPFVNVTTGMPSLPAVPGIHDIKLPSKYTDSNATAPDSSSKRAGIIDKISDDITNKHNRTQVIKDINEYNKDNTTEIAIVIDTKKLKFDMMQLKDHTMPELESLVIPAMSDIENAKVAIGVYGLLWMLSFCVTLKIDDYKKLNTEKLVLAIQSYVSYYKNGEGQGSGFPNVTRTKKFVSYSMHQMAVWIGVTQNCLPPSTIAGLNLASEEDCMFYSKQINLDQYLSNGILIGNMKEPPSTGSAGYTVVGGGHSPKFEAILSAATGMRAVFYSSFEENGIVAFMEFLRDRNQTFEYLNINIDTAEKNMILANFKASTSPCFLCIHPSYTEGVTIAGAQQMHILEPIRLFSTKEQVVARVARLGSHAHLPNPEDHKVEIFQWACNMEKPLDIFRKMLVSADGWLKNNNEVIYTENYAKFGQDETPDSIILRAEATNSGDQDQIKALLEKAALSENLTCCIKYPMQEQTTECLALSSSGQGTRLMHPANLISCNANSRYGTEDMV
jgi:hypothetical protein